MGDSEPMMKLVCTLAFLALVVALPSPDTMVPEVTMTQQHHNQIQSAHHAAAEEAKATITQMVQAGQDDTACEELAETLLDEVQQMVDSQQSSLDALDTGADCQYEGQQELEDAQHALDNAKDAAEAAATRAAEKAGATVDFGLVALSSLHEESGVICGMPIQSSEYTNAKHAAAGAAAEASTAHSAIQGFQQALETAETAAQKAVKKCQCHTFFNYQTAFENAMSHTEANQKAWTKGKHMKCVLDTTPADECKTDDVPTITDVTLADGITGEDCEEYAPTPPPTAPPTPPPTDGNRFTTYVPNVGITLTFELVSNTCPSSSWNSEQLMYCMQTQCAGYGRNMKLVADNANYASRAASLGISNVAPYRSLGNSGHLADSQYWDDGGALGPGNSKPLGDWLYSRGNFCTGSADASHALCSDLNKRSQGWNGGSQHWQSRPLPAGWKILCST